MKIKENFQPLSEMFITVARLAGRICPAPAWHHLQIQLSSLNFNQLLEILICEAYVVRVILLLLLGVSEEDFFFFFFLQ